MKYLGVELRGYSEPTGSYKAKTPEIIREAKMTERREIIKFMDTQIQEVQAGLNALDEKLPAVLDKLPLYDFNDIPNHLKNIKIKINVLIGLIDDVEYDYLPENHLKDQLASVISYIKLTDRIISKMGVGKNTDIESKCQTNLEKYAGYFQSCIRMRNS